MHKTAEQIADEVLTKIAGYFQNVVGFDSLDRFQKQRDAALANDAAFEEYQSGLLSYKKDKGLGKAPDRQITTKPGLLKRLFTSAKPIKTDNPEYAQYRDKSKALDSEYRKNNPEPEDTVADTGRFGDDRFGGTEYGNLDKYISVDAMLGDRSRSLMSADIPVRKGYLPKEEMLDFLSSTYGMDESNSDIYKKLNKSPHKFFTSTDVD